MLQNLKHFKYHVHAQKELDLRALPILDIWSRDILLGNHRGVIEI
jgi:hypothetical protein